MMIKNDEYYMRIAILEAKKAYIKGEVPVGAIIVYQDKIIARGYNVRETKKSVFGHAEIVAIMKATKKLKQKFLDGCSLYVTLEPCLMCAGVIQAARIKKVIYSAREPKFGCFESQRNVYQLFKGNHDVQVIGGLLEEVTSQMMKDFFKTIRENKL